MTARTTTHEALTDCPACDKPITAEVAYDLTLDAKGDQGGERTATLTPVGARISHDCMPKVYREAQGCVPQPTWTESMDDE